MKPTYKSALLDAMAELAPYVLPESRGNVLMILDRLAIKIEKLCKQS